MEETVAFVIRVVASETGLRGTIERVRTRERRRFHDLAMLGRLITEMATGATGQPEPPPVAPP
jgi:hypothetical protein